MDILDQEERRIAQENAAFDPTLNVSCSHHALYNKALVKLREHDAINMLQDTIERVGGSMVLGGEVYVSRGDGCPDKPGTVRSPGIRRQFSSNRKQRWSTL